MRALSPVIINKDKENRESTQTCTAHAMVVQRRTQNTQSHYQCDKYGFSLVQIIHRGHLQDILSPFKQPPTSEKQGSNERVKPGQC